MSKTLAQLILKSNSTAIGKNSSAYLLFGGTNQGTEMKKYRRNISPQDREAASNLRGIWERKKRDFELTQEKAAEQFGGTQGLISQYLNGTIALGPVAVIKWSRILQVAPKDIRKDFKYSVVSEDLTPRALELAYKWLSLPPRHQNAIEQHLETLLEAVSGTNKEQEPPVLNPRH